MYISFGTTRSVLYLLLILISLSFSCMQDIMLAREPGQMAEQNSRSALALGQVLYTRYPIVARAWPSGCIGRVRARAKESCIQGQVRPQAVRVSCKQKLYLCLPICCVYQYYPKITGACLIFNCADYGIRNRQSCRAIKNNDL